jgi:hypothetical protein
MACFSENCTMAFDRPKQKPLRLKIEGLIGSADRVGERVRIELPTHSGLAGVAEHVAGAAREADRLSRKLKRPWSLHRAPVVFLAAAVLLLGIWTYFRFFHVSILSVALPDRDASALRKLIADQPRVAFSAVIVPGSRAAAEMVARGDADLAFVQGGISIAADLPRLEAPSPELVIWMARENVENETDIRRVLTSTEYDGSHSVAADFLKAWGVAGQVTFLHEWQDLTANEAYKVPDEVDSVFVVKDPADEKTLAAVRRLAASGFRIRSPEIGVHETKLDYLRATSIPKGYLASDPPLPGEPIRTFAVSTYLVARRGLTPRLLGVAATVFEKNPVAITDGQFSPTVVEASEIFQGIDAFLGIIVNIGLAFLALLGVEVMTYRKRFHELNSLVSLISMLQSNKDVLGIRDTAIRTERLLYLAACSDLLGLVSMISGYYTQENSSLLFNNLSEVIHQRCDGLKINIQLKILHAIIALPEPLKPHGDVKPDECRDIHAPTCSPTPAPA